MRARERERERGGLNTIGEKRAELGKKKKRSLKTQQMTSGSSSSGGGSSSQHNTVTTYSRNRPEAHHTGNKHTHRHRAAREERGKKNQTKRRFVHTCVKQ